MNGKEKKKKVAIMVILIGVLFVAWYLVLLGPFAAKRGRKAAETTEEPAPGAAGAPRAVTGAVAGAPGEKKLPSLRDVEDLLNRAQVLLTAEDEQANVVLEDPFMWPDEKRTEEPSEDIPVIEVVPEPDLSFSLRAILWDEVRPMAVINGRTVGEGNLVGDGIRVVDITPESVTLRYRYRGRENRLVLSINQGGR